MSNLEIQGPQLYSEVEMFRIHVPEWEYKVTFVEALNTKMSSSVVCRSTKYRDVLKISVVLEARSTALSSIVVCRNI